MPLNPPSANRSMQAKPIRLMGAMGGTQILAWGSTFYLPAVLATPIARDSGWSLSSVIAGLSWGLLVAGFSSPKAGKLIDQFGGRPILAASSLLLALGLMLLGLAPNLIVYYLAWTILGVGMATGLYDAAFATLGRLLGDGARNSMTGLTLLGGFASTLGWPAITGLESWLGWRDTCLVLAAIHVLVGLPIHLLLIPREQRREIPAPVSVSRNASPAEKAGNRLFLLVALFLTIQALVMSSMSVHLLDTLTQLGFATATALAIGMLIGPSQVVARVLEFWLGRNRHPTWSARAGIFLCLVGIGLLVPAIPGLAFLGAVLYGAGNGILTIARGTLPLALFGQQGYGARMGLLARPMLIAQACGPVLAALALGEFGPAVLLMMLCILIAIGFLASWRLPTSLRAPSAS